MKSNSGSMKTMSLLVWLIISLPGLVSAQESTLILDDNFDWADLAVFAEQWLSNDCSPVDWCDGADFDKSGGVDFTDLAFFGPYWLKKPPITISRIAGFQDDETWDVLSGTGVTVAADTADFKYGTQSLKVTCGQATTGTITCTLPAPITVRSGIGFWVKTDNATALTYLRIECYEDTGTKNHRTINLLAQTLPGSAILKLRDNVWNFIWLPKAGYPAGGNPWVASNSPAAWGTAANPTYTIKIVRFVFVVTGACNIRFGDLVAQEAPKAAIVLGFDGPYSSVYTEAFPVMQARGWRGVIWAVAGNIGTAGYMTAAQIQELYNAGWDICSHGYSGVTYNLDGSTAASAVRADITNAINTLHNNGWYRGSQFHSWMGNIGRSAADPNTGEKAGDIAKGYFLGCRALSLFALPENQNGVYTYWEEDQWSLWIPPNWHSLAYYANNYGSNTSFAYSMQGFVDLTIAMRGVLNTYTHRILASPGLMDVSTGFFSAMIDYLDTKVAAGEIEVITMSDWYERATVTSEP